MLGLRDKNKTKKTVALIAAAVFLFLIAHGAKALEVGLGQVEAEIQLGGDDIRVIIARIINVALGLLGVVALLIIIIGGFKWMMAGGDETKVKSARAYILQGVVGMVIVLSAFAIARFVLNSLLGIGGPAGRRVVPPASEIVLRSGSLGRGIIDTHYPTRGQEDVPRNTNIMITFKQSIKLNSIIEGYNDNNTPDNLADDTVRGVAVTITDGAVTAPALNLRTDALKIYKAAEGRDRALASGGVAVRFMPNRLTFVFDPVAYLGSPSEDMLYTVELPGGGGSLRFSNGDIAFTGAFASGYVWQFTTGTVIDVTPPIVETCFPRCGRPPSPPTGTQPRNVLIQVNFNEAIDPTSITSSNVLVASGAVDPPTFPYPTTGLVSGEWLIANNYRTIEFRPSTACGTNSCGETIYCLPGPSHIGARVKSARILTSADRGYDADQPAKSFYPYNGVADAAMNSLNDQGVNDLPGDTEISDGPPDDNVNFNFETTSAIDLTPPVIEAVTPGTSSGGSVGDILPNEPVTVTFSKIMSPSSINTSSILLLPQPDHELWYGVGAVNLTAALVVAGPTDDAVKTRALVSHGLFLRTPIGSSYQGYVPRIKSRVSETFPGVRDAYQNCFVPAEGPGCSPNETSPFCCNGVRRTTETCTSL